MKNIKKKARKVRAATLIPGDGIGPEISEAVVEIFKAAEVPLEWETVNLSTAHVKPGEPLISKEVEESINRTGLGLKGFFFPFFLNSFFNSFFNFF